MERAEEEPESERFSRFRSVGRSLQQCAAKQPLVIVLDDAHTVDADGLLLTRFVARSAAGHRLLLVLPHRTSPDVAPSALSLLVEIGGEGIALRLHGLGRDEVRELVAATGEAAEPIVVRRVQELTAGNPFLVGQVLVSGLHRHDRSVPDAARRLLDAQLDALDAATRSVLDAASVAGHTDEALRLERELEEIISHARAATGLGGRSRHFDDATERARTSVQKAIRRAIANIAQDSPKLAAALTASVHTGYWSRYEPRSGAPEHWYVRSD